MAKSVKLADIAQKLGVSTVTVSKALSDQKGVSDEVRAQIKHLAASMGYTSPSAAKIQKERKSFNVGVLVASRYFDQMQSFYWMMYQELATKALNENCFTMLEVVQNEEENNNVVPKLLEQSKVDGIVVIGMMQEEYLKIVDMNSKVPIIYLDFYNKNLNSDAVVSDNYFGMYKMTDYLCQLGHKKIAYVGTLFATNSITDRYFGYMKALMENSIEPRKDYIIEDRDLKTGNRKSINKSLPNDMPTAFVCNCDVTAFSLISELKDLGYEVPLDISVVGFDNYPVQNLEDMQLTTYEVDVKEMANKAIENLIRKMNGEYFKTGVTVVEGHMVIKETCKRV